MPVSAIAAGLTAVKDAGTTITVGAVTADTSLMAPTAGGTFAAAVVAAPSPQDCVSSWSAYTACSAGCTKTRSTTVTQEPDPDGAQVCRAPPSPSVALAAALAQR